MGSFQALNEMATCPYWDVVFQFCDGFVHQQGAHRSMVIEAIEEGKTKYLAIEHRRLALQSRRLRIGHSRQQ